MWETWDELPWRPVILSSIVVVFWPAVNVMVPFAVMPAPAGFSVKWKTFGLGDAELLAEGCAEADGEAVAAWSPPQAVAPRRIRPTAILHSALGIPVQVTGAGRGFIPGPVPCLLVTRDA